MKSNDPKPDPRITSAVLVALKKARLYNTKLAVSKDDRVLEMTPDEFERHLPDNARS